MKYKNIPSAIHNFGHSFVSHMNYVDGDYVIDDLIKLHAKGKDIKVDWLTGLCKPKDSITSRIRKSVAFYKDGIKKHFLGHNVSLDKTSVLEFIWMASERKKMIAVDDDGKKYEIEISEPELNEIFIKN